MLMISKIIVLIGFFTCLSYYAEQTNDTFYMYVSLVGVLFCFIKGCIDTLNYFNLKEEETPCVDNNIKPLFHTQEVVYTQPNTTTHYHRVWREPTIQEFNSQLVKKCELNSDKLEIVEEQKIVKKNNIFSFLNPFKSKECVQTSFASFQPPIETFNPQPPTINDFGDDDENNIIMLTNSNKVSPFVKVVYDAIIETLSKYPTTKQCVLLQAIQYIDAITPSHIIIYEKNTYLEEYQVLPKDAICDSIQKALKNPLVKVEFQDYKLTTIYDYYNQSTK